MRSLVLILLLFVKSALCQQEADSTVKKTISIFAGFQYHSNIEYGIFYYPTQVKYFEVIKRSLDEVYSASTFSVLAGLRFKKTFHTLNFASINQNGVGHLDIEGYNLAAKYFNYQFGFAFLYKKKFPVKPFAELNLSFLNETFSYSAEYNSYNNEAFGKKYEDKATAYFIQPAIGAIYNSENFLISVAYNFLVYASIKGNFKDSETYYYMPQYSHSMEESYSGTLSSSNFSKQKGTINLKLAYAFNLN